MWRREVTDFSFATSNTFTCAIICRSKRISIIEIPNALLFLIVTGKFIAKPDTFLFSQYRSIELNSRLLYLSRASTAIAIHAGLKTGLLYTMSKVV
ncbi:MAG: hypothetical protein OEM45_01345, partial [Gammaproteobacteria bacterium]|nr:hypothetical protein [Gammaproteobacteria bacterium]